MTTSGPLPRSSQRISTPSGARQHASAAILPERVASAPMPPVQHAPHNAMTDADEIARFHDRCSDLMRALLHELAATPGRARTFPQIEDALGWPRRRIASVLGGVHHL